MGLTALEHHGLVDVDEDRIYNPMTADRLKEVPFLDGKAEDYKTIEAMIIEIVDLPINSMVIFQFANC